MRVHGYNSAKEGGRTERLMSREKVSAGKTEKAIAE